MKNWSGSLEFFPEMMITPTKIEEIKNAIDLTIKNNKTIRPFGSMHSWTPLYNTDEYLLNLSKFSGKTSMNIADKKMSFLSGTKMNVVTDILFDHKLSLVNQGDINAQSLSGALSTGTHGTGETLRSMSNQMSSFKLIDGTCSEHIISKNKDAELFNALAISMGLAGILTEIEIQAIDLYALEVKTEAVHMNDIVANLDSLIKNNRHFELFYFPIGDWAIMKTMNIVSNYQNKVLTISDKISKYINDVVIENYLFELINIIAKSSGEYQQLDKLMKKFVSPNLKAGYAQHVFPTQRNVKFMEMEFNIPREDFHAVLKQVRNYAKSNQVKTLFPIEIRFAAADDLWLSPNYKRDSAYLAVHTYQGENWVKYFYDFQEIFKSYQGRPHWGKWHSLNDQYFNQVYPKYADFKALLNDFDPNGIFKHQNLNFITN